MKKIILVVFLTVLFYSCQESTELTKNEELLSSIEKCETNFYYKVGNDGEYSKRAKEFSVNEPVYMNVSVDVEAEKGLSTIWKAVLGTILGLIISIIILGLLMLLGLIGIVPLSIFCSLLSFFLGVMLMFSWFPSNTDVNGTINAYLQIPLKTNIEIEYFDGKKLDTPNIEFDTMIYTLPIEIKEGKTVEDYFVFQILSENTTTYPVSVMFDEPLSKYNTQGTIRFTN